MPRAGIGAVSIPPLVVLERRGPVRRASRRAIADAVDQLDAGRDSSSPTATAAAVLARRIGRTMPLIYGGGALGEVAALRWKSQFNENAKVAGVLPTASPS